MASGIYTDWAQVLGQLLVTRHTVLHAHRSSLQCSEGNDLGDGRAAAGHPCLSLRKAFVNSLCSTEHSLRVGHCAGQLGSMQRYGSASEDPRGQWRKIDR